MENKQATLTRGQQEVYDFLRERLPDFLRPPTLDELCQAMGLKSRGSLHKQLQALIDAGLVAPMNRRQRGVRLTDSAPANEDELPFRGYIAAGRPIEAIAQPETIAVPDTPLYLDAILTDEDFAAAPGTGATPAGLSESLARRLFGQRPPPGQTGQSARDRAAGCCCAPSRGPADAHCCRRRPG